ncbi:uncharacterized protein G2W53_041363 [Senna tora]|uniref:Uncharacterized protein n=1 Tax=Senna tora TaxID=362788 RepID=A0A834VYP5_9FABA|nr:uncharacterized protein G2W53_041363 [Senna tora]
MEHKSNRWVMVLSYVIGKLVTFPGDMSHAKGKN